MKNASRLSPEAIERLQEPSRVDEGIETYEARDSNARRGVVSFPASDSEQVSVPVNAGIVQWFREHAPPGENVETSIDHVLMEHIAREIKKAS
jgi:hypothetical protein